MKKTVISHIIGGLGNQLFQYAAGLAAANRNDAQLRIDLFDFAWYRRPYFLEPFRITAPAASRWDRLQLDVYRRLGADSVRKDPGGYKYDPKLLEMEPHRKIFLVGHWQNQKYFSDIRPRLLDEFRLKEERSALASTIGRDITGSESVAVHVRRGDNIAKPDLKNPARMVAQLGTVSEQYLSGAMQLIHGQRTGARFFVFSDEIDWVRQNLKLPYPVTYVPAADFTDVQQFELMANCRHQIIANSTFSWWAAWLNSNPEKIVCAPKRWDARIPDYDTSGLLPASWHLVE